MDTHNFKKQFGQNFLQSKKYLDDIYSTINISDKDIMLEVGPGQGALTSRLVKSGAIIKSIEIDYSLYKHLYSEFERYSNWNLIEKDILQLNLSELSATKMVGNLPYNISKKIIMNFLQSNIQEAYFLIQKEVAEDYACKIDNTFLGNMVKAYGTCEYLFTVPKEQFVPTPKVDGGYIKIIKHKDIDIVKAEELIKFIHSCFSHPRKTLINNLKHIKNIRVHFESLNLNPNIRPHEMLFENFQKLFELKS